jgi:hypothetical protein
MSAIKALIKRTPQIETCECPLHDAVICVVQACCRRCAKAAR